MLYYLIYTNHEIEKLHELLEFFFNKVEKEKPNNFNSTLLFPSWYKNTKNKLRDLEKSLTMFLSFDEDLKIKIIEAFKKANEINVFFFDDTINIPIAKDFECYEWKYIQNGKSITSNIGKYLEDLFVGLYNNQLSKRLIDKAPFAIKVKSDVSDHYIRFRDNNSEFRESPFTLCPFCGLEPLKMIESEGRPYYDHILPKGNLLYVFSAVNLMNLVPIGSICNTLKNTANLLYSDDDRSKRTISFYPYDNTAKDPFDVISITLSCINVPKFRQNGKWSVFIAPKDSSDLILIKKITTWNRVFKIQNRYAEFLESDYAWIKNLISGLTSKIDAKNKLEQAYSDIKPTYSVIAIESGIMLKQAFYRWALDSSDFLPSFFDAIQLNKNQNSSVSLNDLE